MKAELLKKRLFTKRFATKKVIWMYWDKGADSAPPLIRASMNTVLRKSKCKVNIVDAQSARLFIKDMEPYIFEALKPAHQADIFRIAALERYGGMYLDADTIVVEDLRPLFSLLSQYSIVGADWKPVLHPETIVKFGVGIIGPVRPRHPLITAIRNEQKRRLSQKRGMLLRAPWDCTQLNENYCFSWEELLNDIAVNLTREGVPSSYIFSGAETWYAYVGGSEWEGGNGRHIYRPLDKDEVVLKSPLYTYSLSLAPPDVFEKSLEELYELNWILLLLLKKGASH